MENMKITLNEILEATDSKNLSELLETRYNLKAYLIKEICEFMKKLHQSDTFKDRNQDDGIDILVTKTGRHAGSEQYHKYILTNIYIGKYNNKIRCNGYIETDPHTVIDFYLSTFSVEDLFKVLASLTVLYTDMDESTEKLKNTYHDMRNKEFDNKYTQKAYQNKIDFAFADIFQIKYNELFLDKVDYQL